MFQWLSAVRTRVNVDYFKKVDWLNAFSWAILVLLAFQYSSTADAGDSPPKWTVPVQQSSDDGYALLAWEAGEGDESRFFKITETFGEKVTDHYTETTELRAWRVQPGEYAFVLQSCVKNSIGAPDCGSSSSILSLVVTEAVTSTLIAQSSTEDTPQSVDGTTNSGPEQLRPGHWFNLAKDGHGWSFYWSNRLALPQDDPLFGNSYDLVGIWYTHEAKLSERPPGCASCPPVTSAYRPVVLKLKAVLTSSGLYAGSLYVSRSDGSELWVGSANVVFGSNNTKATVNWSANFKKENLSDSDPLVYLLGSDPANATNISHFSGLWQHARENRYLVVTNIGDIAEVVTVVFHDDAGDPTWIQAKNNGSAVSGSSNFCLAYLSQGYSPQDESPAGWSQEWYLSGCDPSQASSDSNRNGRRYFYGLDKQNFWADFTLPGTAFASGSISIGTNSATIPLEKTASFHGVSYSSSDGSFCELTGNTPTCEVQLTWYTDGNYPNATVFAHNISSNTYDKVLTSRQAAMVDIPYQISVAGQYEFELHMGDGQQTTLMARSDVFTVIEDTVVSQPERPPAPASPPAMNASSSSSRVGTTSGAFRVDESGSASYSIPILTAPASGGVGPQISLNYNSQSGNGEVGVGWSIGGVSAISLCPQTMEQDGVSGSRGIRLDGSDRFCLDGQRLVLDPSSGDYGNDGTRYRTEIDSFSRVTSYGTAGNGPAWFKVERKDGSVVEYGNSVDSSIEARGSETPATVMTWAQNRFENRSGNYILYSYLENNTGPVAFVLQTIDYTGNTRAGTLPSARLSFTYRDRNADEDLVFTYLAGVEVEQRHLLQSIRSQGRIDAGSPLEDLRFYELAYEEDGVGRSILTSLTECRSVNRSTCYQPTRFDWLKSESKIDLQATVLNGLLPSSTLSGMLLADVSGDGRADLLYTKLAKQNYFLYVKEATASASFSEWAASYKLPKKADGSPPRVFAIDINSDGFQDIVYSKYRRTTKDYSWVALTSNGNGFSAEIELNSSHRFFLTGQALESRFQIMDFNGDGLSDILHAHTDLLGQNWQLTILLNISRTGGSPALSAPIKLEVANADLFPLDISGEWGIELKPPFFEWSAVSAEDNEIPDARIFDFNGDGAVDLLLKVWRNYRKCISNCVPQLTIPGDETQGGKNKGPVYEYKFASFWVLMESNGQNAFNRHSIVAMGDGCTLGAICQNPEYEGLPRSDYVWPVDINADGLADIAWGDLHENWYFQLNTGNGFAAAQLIDKVPEGVNKLVRLEDRNGDSYPDLVYPSRVLSANATWMTNQNHFGRAFAAATNTLVLAGNVGGDQDVDAVENDASVFADFNGDGKVDQLLINNDTNGEILSTSIRRGMNVSGSRGVEPANVITSITDGFGAVTKIFYKPLTDRSVYSRMHDSVNAHWGNGSAVYDLIAPIYVVSQVSSSAPVYNNPLASSHVQYHYVGAKVQAGGRGFLGFGEVISYDPQLQIRTNSRYRQDFPFIGMLVDTTRVSNAAGARFATISNTSTNVPNNWGTVSSSTSFPSPVTGTPLGYVLNQWASKSTTGAAIFPHITGSIEIKHTLQGRFDRKTLTAINYDTYGNVTGSSASTYATEGGGVFAREVTSNTYSNNVAKWFLGQLSTSRVTYARAGESSITRQTSFAYDPVSGLLKQEITDPNSNVFRITTDYQLDTFGNRKQTTVTGVNMTARKAVARYDSLGRFVTEGINALNQTTQKIISHDVFGNPLEVVNIDGVRTISAADFMGRTFAGYTETGVWSKVISEFGPFKPSSLNSHHCPQTASFRTITTGGGAATRVQCFDQLERAIRTAVKTLGGSYAYTDQHYDSSGRVARVTEPYFKGDTVYWNVTGYDRLGRMTSINSAAGDDLLINYDSTVSTTCSTATTRVVKTTNGIGQKKVEVKNALGETVEVFDDLCGGLSYKYNAVGNLTRVTGADNAVVTMSYDTAGRKTAMDDPDKGYWQYAYNALGEITRQLDSKRQAVDFTYDKLGRVTNRRELTGVTSLAASSGYTIVNREVSSYISTGSGVGQVDWVAYRNGESGTDLHVRSFTYDLYGRVIKAETDIAGELGTFFERTTYDQYSRLFQKFDASGDDRGLRYVYSNGYLSKIKEAREGVSGTIYQDIQAMDARGNVTAMRLGNGVDAYATYEDSSGRLTNLSAFDSLGIEIQNVEYLFDVLGNLKKRHDESTSRNLKEAFTYDRINRLTRVLLTAPELSLNGAPTLSLNYDASGNIKCKSDVGGINGADGCFNTLARNYSYGNSAGPHAVTAAGGVNYTYDANGNQTSSSDGRTIAYSVFDKPGTISKGANRTDFSYGVGNNRYQREDYESSVLQKSTLYLGVVERITENGSTFFKRYLGGVAIATYYPSSGVQQLSYLLKDHIGSIHSVLDASGLITATMHFSAFGERQGADWQTPLTSFLYSPLNEITTRGFTGHEQVDTAGIIHMNGRIYDPKLGRFLQADPVVQAPTNSQSLNRYSYVLNNPLSHTDPSGYFSLKSFFKKWGRLIIAAVVTYVTYGAASGWAAGWLAGTALAGNTVAIGAIAGAISGFVGGAIIDGNIKGAMMGAFSGAIMGGVAGHFGNTYSVKRIAADSLASGVSSEIYGGKFKTGLLFGALVSSATFVNVKLREFEYNHSLGTPGQIGESPGHRGISGKIGGARLDQDLWKETGQKVLESGGTVKDALDWYIESFKARGRIASPLGCHQGGPGCIFGKPYKPGSVFDYVVEGFAGTHDYLNHPVYYNPDGTSRTLTGFSRRYGQFRNVTNVFLAAPIVLPSLIPDQLRYLALTEFD